MSDTKVDAPWGWLSRMSVTFEDYDDKISVLVLTSGVIVYATQTEFPGIFRMNINDMRIFGQALLDGAAELEARNAEHERLGSGNE